MEYRSEFKIGIIVSVNGTAVVALLLFVFGIAPLLSFSQTKADKDSGRHRRGLRPALLRGPYLQKASSQSMTIRWRTDTYDRGRVLLGSDSARMTGFFDDSTLSTEHIITISGLKPLTKYYYSVGDIRDTIGISGMNYFYTLPEPGMAGRYRIGVFGDMGNNSVNERQVRDQFLKYIGDDYLNAWLLLGDNAYPDGSDQEFQVKFFDIYKDKLLRDYPLFPSPGNHDYHDVKSAPEADTNKIDYYAAFSMPKNGESGGVPSGNAAYYSYDIGNIHFLSIDSYGTDRNGRRFFDPGSEEMQWIEKDLAANKNKQWVVAYWHHPPYTMGSHNSDNSSELVKIRKYVAPVMEKYGVDLVLCGHSHDYERSRLMRGYFGNEASFDSAKYDLSLSSGKDDGSPNSAPYVKNAGTNEGTVYVVAGSAGQLGGTQPGYPHNAMPYSSAEIGGAVLLDVEGNKLVLKWICADGKIRDQFTMIKR
jgi:3',5'-cyclic AMP phosphodiesterase CpdA